MLTANSQCSLQYSLTPTPYHPTKRVKRAEARCRLSASKMASRISGTRCIVSYFLSASRNSGLWSRRGRPRETQNESVDAATNLDDSDDSWDNVSSEALDELQAELCSSSSVFGENLNFEDEERRG